MPAISLDGDKTNEHDGFNPGTASASAVSFTVAKTKVLRVGDTISTHAQISDPSVKHENKTISEGAPSFTIGGKAVARAGDPTDCGGKMVGGNASFTVGGKKP